jgi:hypothetical protein
MREPDFVSDGWCLEDGEAYHAEAPDTFWIPEQHRREGLVAGDLAKLIFRISVDNADESVAVERMWVLVRERTADGYLGVLDNEPNAIAENDELLVCLEKIGPILKRARLGMRIGEMYGTSAIYAGADYREAA